MPAAAETKPALVGRTIGQRYVIEEHVGGGAMGDVYRARHVGLGTDVAVKIMRAAIADEAHFKERFYREAKAASLLEHPNSVRVLDFGEDSDGLVYLVMEFLRGQDLLDVVRRDWPLTEDRIVEILAQTLAAISTAHMRGIVHRDLKPENIMIVADGDDAGRDIVKVCDFGIAKVVGGKPIKSHEDATTALTTGNALIGTPEYMSPEQARGEPLDARSDLYSVGVILFRLLTGRLPFEAENAIGMAVKHITEPPPRPSRVNPGVNRRLEAICLRALEKDPAARPQSAKEMRSELKAALGLRPSGGSLPESLTALERASTVSGDLHEEDVRAALPRRSLLLPLLAAGGLVLGAGLVFAMLPAKSEVGADAGAGLVASAPASAVVAVATAAPSTSSSGPGIVVSATPPARKPARGHGGGRSAEGPVAAGSVASTSTLPLPSTTTPTLPSTTTSTLPSMPPVAPSPAPETPYRPANALVGRESLAAERVQRDVIDRKMAELGPRFSECYRDALLMAGAPVGGTADIHMSIDASGSVVSVVTARQLPPFQRCVGRLLTGFTVPKSAVDPGGGTAQQTLRLTP